MVDCCRFGDTERNSACMRHSEGGHRYLHYLHHSLVAGQKTEGTQTYQSTENWTKDLLSMDLPMRTDTVSPTVSLSLQEASMSLLSLSFRGQTE